MGFGINKQLGVDSLEMQGYRIDDLKENMKNVHSKFQGAQQQIAMMAKMIRRLNVVTFSE